MILPPSPMTPSPGPGVTDPDRSGHPVPPRPTGNRRLIVTLAVSLGLHAAAVIAVLLLLHAGVPVVASVEKPTEVELVMEEHKGDLRPTSTPSPSQPPAKPTPAAEKPPVQQTDPSEAKATPPPPDPVRDAAEPAPPPAQATDPAQTRPDTPASQPAPETPVQEAKREPDPAPQAAQPVPVISLQGTDSPSDARAFGDRVIPAKPDAVFHNRPPVYPVEAAMNGQQGVVVVLIHVAPDGTAAGVDLVRSSGYVLLDSAARDAVLRWHFLPAVKDGQPVASDMTMGFEFDDIR